MESIQNIKTINPKKHQITSWSLLIGLLFMRIPFLTGGYILFGDQIWLIPIFEITTYLLTALLIYHERNRLADFYIDKLALLIILFAKPLETIILATKMSNDSPLALPHLPGILIWLIAFALTFALWRKKPTLAKLTKTSLIWFAVGLLVGLVTSILLAYPGSFQIQPGQLLSKTALFEPLREIPVLFFYQLGFAAVAEEPLFRGFLWGFLQKSGWKNIWIWLFQAGLFSIAHFYYISVYPISFWVIIPIGSLVLGLLVWRSKTISACMSAHATLNAFGNILWRIAASIRI